MFDILHQTTIEATPAEVFEALTTKEGIQSWWSVHTEATPSTDHINVAFDNNTVVFKLRVSELVPNEKVVWTVEGGPPTWPGTKISWQLSSGETGTGVAFSHGAFPEMSDGYAMVNYSWGWFITSLSFYLKQGAGMPYADAS